MGLGMILLLLSCVCSLAMIFFQGNNCSTEYYDNSTYIYCDSAFPYNQPKYSINLNYISIQNICECLLDICFFILLLMSSYVPRALHSMKGLLIGTFFAIKGVFKLLGVLVIYVPYHYFCVKQKTTFGVCGFYLLPNQCCDSSDWLNSFHHHS